MKRYLKINDKDNVAVALLPLKKGDITEEGICLNEDIEAGHKFALKDIESNEAVIKDGNLIGYATKDGQMTVKFL